MPERIDVLSTAPGTGATFRVNIAAASVPITTIAAVPTLLSADGKSIFERGDNFVLLSAGFFMPESFVLYNQTSIQMDSFGLIAQKAHSAGIVPITSIGNDGRLFVPFMGYEMSVGTYVDVEGIGIDDDFTLEAASPATGPQWPLVSMTNVPAALDGLDFEVTTFIKVLHNFQLT